MAIQHSTAVRNAIANAFAILFDTDGLINIYTGAMPATGDAAATGTLLGTLALSSDSFGSASGGVVAANAITNDSLADASGTPGYFVMYKAGETAPGSVAAGTDDRLMGTIGALTLLNGAINAAVTTITVDDTTHFPASGSLVIDSERMSYTGKTATTFTGITRGTGGTTAATHADNATVKEADRDMHFNSLAWAQNAILSISALSWAAPV